MKKSSKWNLIMGGLWLGVGLSRWVKNEPFDLFATVTTCLIIGVVFLFRYWKEWYV